MVQDGQGQACGTACMEALTLEKQGHGGSGGEASVYKPSLPNMYKKKAPRTVEKLSLACPININPNIA